MRTSIKHIALLLLCAAVVPEVAAQSLTSQLKDPEENQGISVRAQALYADREAKESDNSSWKRIIYREIDLTTEKNGVLYFPEEPMNGQTNLFRLIMDKLTHNEAVAYEYLDGRELFTEEYQVVVKDMLDRFHILYEEENVRGSRNKVYTVAESDVPCNEVLSYYVREEWVFNPQRSEVIPTIVAICPVMHRASDFGGEAIKYPMFWIEYKELYPYLVQQPVMSSSRNNAMNITLDDYFKLRLFEGEIYKTGNLSNKSLVQLFPNDSLRAKEQKRIEQELVGFQENLWTKEASEADSTAVTTGSSVKAQERSSSSSSFRLFQRDNSDKPKEDKPKSSKADTPKADKAPIRSVRRTR